MIDKKLRKGGVTRMLLWQEYRDQHPGGLLVLRALRSDPATRRSEADPDDFRGLFHRGKRVASHARNPGRRSHITVPDHMPSSHRRYAEWTPARILASAEKLGPSVAAFCQIVMENRPHPEQGFRTCLGVLSLAKSYEPARLDAACQRAVAIKARSVASIRSILQTGLNRAFLEPEAEELTLQQRAPRKRYH
jgi:transposase